MDLAEVLPLSQIRGMNAIEKISRLIEERKLTQSGVERAAVLSGNRISKWKAGEGEPTYRQIARVARVLNAPLEWLCDDAMDWPPSASIEMDGLTDDERYVLRTYRYLRNERGISPEEAAIRMAGSATTEPIPSTGSHRTTRARDRTDQVAEKLDAAKEGQARPPKRD